MKTRASLAVCACLTVSVLALASSHFAVAQTPKSRQKPAAHASASASASAPGFSSASPLPIPVPEPTKIWTSCIEHMPSESARPKLTEKFPTHGLSGYAATLEITVEHGKGETVLPNGIQLQLDSEGLRSISEAGFAIPSPDGGAGSSITRSDMGDRAKTVVQIPFVSLPKKPGRNALVLPPVPIALARASGELVTVCTAPHNITVDDPIASTPDAAPKANPQPRAQREEWTAMRNATIALGVGALISSIFTWLLLRYLRRPRPVPPPPPPRPAWELAFEELAQLRSSSLLQEAKHGEYLDRLSDTVRRYLGGRYNFDGIESTTDEVLTVLSKIHPQIPMYSNIEAMLQDCDLVKFAKMIPESQQCLAMLETADQIVRETMPSSSPSQKVQP